MDIRMRDVKAKLLWALGSDFSVYLQKNEVEALLAFIQESERATGTVDARSTVATATISMGGHPVYVAPMPGDLRPGDTITLKIPGKTPEWDGTGGGDPGDEHQPK